MSTAKTKRSAAKIGIEGRTDSAGRSQYRGCAYDPRTMRKVRGPWSYNLAEARSWRIDALAQLQNGLMSGNRGPTVREAADKFITGMKAGTIRNRSGRPYKPSAIRGYERELHNRVIPAFGPKRLADLTLPDIQRWADGLSGAPSTVRNIVNALRAVYAWALPRGLALVNPTAGVRLPTGGKRRERIAPPDEADRLLSALPGFERGIWATAMYAGLRRGELLALRVADVDLEIGRISIHPERGGYDVGGRAFGAPKSQAAVRSVPIVAKLRPYLVAAVADKPSWRLCLAAMPTRPFRRRRLCVERTRLGPTFSPSGSMSPGTRSPAT